jgi:hypothetical protein
MKAMQRQPGSAPFDFHSTQIPIVQDTSLFWMHEAQLGPSNDCTWSKVVGDYAKMWVEGKIEVGSCFATFSAVFQQFFCSFGLFSTLERVETT